jgi:hypothetical protein
MSVFIGRKLNIGIGKEATRATPVASSYWLPKMDFSVEDQIEIVVDDSSLGIIEAAETQEITKKKSAIMVSGRITDLSFGVILSALMGTDTKTTTSGESVVYDHTFSILETAQHPSLTINVSEPNATGSSSLVYALCMLDQLDITFGVGAWATYKAQFIGNANVTGSTTPSFATEHGFNPQYATFKTASSLSGLSGASAISVRNGSITFKKNVEDDPTIGSLAVVDRYNKQFQVTGELVLTYNARTYIDTDMLGDAVVAMQLNLINTGVTIGSTSNPTIQISLARCKITEIARTDKNDDIMLQTIKFTAYYSISDSQMVGILLRNTVSTAY